jgi:hypothetical protein
MWWIVVAAAPAAVWMGVKPVRILAPGLTGVCCVGGTVWTDAPSRAVEASRLYGEALDAVEAEVGTIAGRPRIVFCATQPCYESFGVRRSAAVTFGTLGIVVSPRGWAPHYVRHELIHYLQSQHLGSLRTRFITPRWFIEGMAYSLSRDPRARSSEPSATDRARFDAWRRTVSADRFWIEAARL